MWVQDLVNSVEKYSVPYIKEVILASYVPVIVGLVVGVSSAIVFQSFHWPSATRLMGEPFFALPILVAIIVACLFCTRTHRRPNIWVWIPLAVILVWNLFTWNRYAGQIYYWKDVWNNFIGSECSGSECLYEWTVTAPFYCSLAYSAVAILFRSKHLSSFLNPN
jgi:hypothetical protein